jgi:hypothetical protein
VSIYQGRAQRVLIADCDHPDGDTDSSQDEQAAEEALSYPALAMMRAHAVCPVQQLEPHVTRFAFSQPEGFGPAGSAPVG